jgi:hypothetical protein
MWEEIWPGAVGAVFIVPEESSDTCGEKDNTLKLKISLLMHDHTHP